MSYLLDTDTLSEVGKPHPSEHLLVNLMDVREPIYTSSITVGEMVYGAYRTANPERYLNALEHALTFLNGVLPYDEACARRFGQLLAELEKQGISVEDADLQIATIALTSGLTLVTHNVSHFERIPGLTLEDWLA